MRGTSVSSYLKFPSKSNRSRGEKCSRFLFIYKNATLFSIKLGYMIPNKRNLHSHCISKFVCIQFPKKKKKYFHVIIKFSSDDSEVHWFRGILIWKFSKLLKRGELAPSIFFTLWFKLSKQRCTCLFFRSTFVIYWIFLLIIFRVSQCY